MLCVFISGPVASGKLTVATALRFRTGLRLFHNHYAVDAALSLFDFGVPGFVRMREAIWLSAFAEASAAGQSFIFTFHPEASVPSDFIARAVALVEGCGGEVLFVALTCSEEALESRLEAPGRSAFQKLASVKLYRSLRDAGAFSFSSLPEPALSLPTDILSPEEAAAKISELMESRGNQ